MRYAANRDSFLSPRASSSGSAHYQFSSNPTGPTKKDGTPDMRYAANRAAPSASWFSKHGHHGHGHGHGGHHGHHHPPPLGARPPPGTNCPPLKKRIPSPPLLEPGENRMWDRSPPRALLDGPDENSRCSSATSDASSTAEASFSRRLATRRTRRARASDRCSCGAEVGGESGANEVMSIAYSTPVSDEKASGGKFCEREAKASGLSDLKF